MEKRIDRSVKLKMGAGEGSKSLFPLQGNPAIIPVEDVAALFRCGKCLVAPLRPPVHTCRSGHLTCSSCYQGGAELSKCYKCRGPLEYRNYVLEDVLRNLTVQTCAALNECSSSVHQSISDQSLQILLKDPAVLQQLEDAREEADRLSKEERDQLTWTDYPKRMPKNRASHRPVQCPYPCGRIVTCSGIFPHFEMQHSHVEMKKMYPNTTTVVDVQFMDVLSTEVGCQALFVVHLDANRDQDPNYSAADMLKITRSSQEMLRNKILISTLTVGHLKFPATNDEDSWFLTVWSTCLYDLSPLTYTLCASNSLSSHASSFTVVDTGAVSDPTDHSQNAINVQETILYKPKKILGPLVSLHSSQRPEDVCERGECLLLSPGLLRKMQFSMDNPLKLAVTFHSDL